MIADRCVSKCRVRTAHAALPSLAKAALTSRHCFNDPERITPHSRALLKL